MASKKTMESIKEKIRKCLALAAGAKTEGEAKAATLMAQKLLAKHHLTESDVAEHEVFGNEVGKMLVRCGKSYGPGNWKARLAAEIAENFRCEIWTEHYSKGDHDIVFLGHEEDRELAAQTFETLCAAAKNIHRRWAKDMREKAKREDAREKKLVDSINNHLCRLCASDEERKGIARKIRNTIACNYDVLWPGEIKTRHSCLHDDTRRSRREILEILAEANNMLAQKLREAGRQAELLAIPSAWFEEADFVPVNPADTGAKNSWYRGFADGIGKALADQRESDEELAICLRIPKDVRDEFEEIRLGFRRGRARSFRGNNAAHKAGVAAGKACGSRRAIA